VVGAEHLQGPKWDQNKCIITLSMFQQQQQRFLNNPTHLKFCRLSRKAESYLSFVGWAARLNHTYFYKAEKKQFMKRYGKTMGRREILWVRGLLNTALKTMHFAVGCYSAGSDCWKKLKLMSVVMYE